MTDTIFICRQCASEFTKWSGACQHCGQWNSLEEKKAAPNKKKSAKAQKTFSINDYQTREAERIKTGFKEIDRVFGDGILPGSAILLTGDPGIGKSTLTLQIAHNIAQKKKVLIISGEESVDQISNRAHRLSLKSSQLKLLSSNSSAVAIATALKEKPDLLILDSLQMIFDPTAHHNSGCIAQLKNTTETFVTFAKENTIPVIMIGHVTKEGEVAGPRFLEHLVDVVLNLEGERFKNYRILRSFKNRFGATDEIGVLEMTEMGLRDVPNPSMNFVSHHSSSVIGSAVAIANEGSRSFLVEIQALTTKTNFGYPKRTAQGIPLNKLHIISAVLAKHARLKIDDHDIYLNVVGGFKTQEPAIDLAIALAILSSRLNLPLLHHMAVCGEIGLSGELRKVSQMKKRIKEAEKLGIKKIFTPVLGEKIKSNVEIIEFETLSEVISQGLSLKS